MEPSQSPQQVQNNETMGSTQTDTPVTESTLGSSSPLPESVQTISNPSKSPKKKLLIIIIIILLILAGVAAFLLLNKKDTNTASSVTTNNTKAQTTAKDTATTDMKSMTPTDIIDAIKSEATSLKLKANTSNTNTLTYIDITKNGVSGYSFAKGTKEALYSFADTFNFSKSKGKESADNYCDLASQDFAPVTNAFLKHFRDAGYTETKKGSMFGSYQYNDCSEGYTEILNNEYCSVVISFSNAHAGCGDYSQTQTKIKQAQEVADALNTYFKTTDSKRNIITYFEIEKSQTPGYEIIYNYSLEVAVQDLYRKTGTTAWNIVDENMSINGDTCSLFTGEAKLAFKGKDCYDANNKMQTIQ